MATRTDSGLAPRRLPPGRAGPSPASRRCPTVLDGHSDIYYRSVVDQICRAGRCTEVIVSPRRRADDPGPSLEGCAGAVVGFTGAYLAAEAALPGSAHPTHWLLTLAGAAIGYLIGHATYLVKEGYGPLLGRRRDRRHPRNLGSRRPGQRR